MPISLTASMFGRGNLSTFFSGDDGRLMMFGNTDRWRTEQAMQTDLKPMGYATAWPSIQKKSRRLMYSPLSRTTTGTEARSSLHGQLGEILHPLLGSRHTRLRVGGGNGTSGNEACRKMHPRHASLRALAAHWGM
jgi:hypothetical protein